MIITVFQELGNTAENSTLLQLGGGQGWKVAGPLGYCQTVLLHMATRISMKTLKNYLSALHFHLSSHRDIDATALECHCYTTIPANVLELRHCHQALFFGPTFDVWGIYRWQHLYTDHWKSCGLYYEARLAWLAKVRGVFCITTVALFTC